MHAWFRKAAHATAEAVGTPWAFMAAVVATILWAFCGPYFHYSDSWQLIINTGTTIATFLMVFLIQNTQNRDAKVMQMKLDELIRAISSARTELVQMESLSDAELNALHDEFQRLQEHAAKGLKQIEESRKKRPASQRV